LRDPEVNLYFVVQSNHFEALVIDKLLLVFCAHHVLERRQYEALNSVASVRQIISDHHADLMSKIPHLVNQYVSCGDVKEKLEMILEVKSIVAIREDG